MLGNNTQLSEWGKIMTINVFGYTFDFGPWQAFALIGNFAFTTRFLVQWIASERQGKSVVPVTFWWWSIVGSLVLLIYFIHRHDIIGVMGYAVNLIPYTRNLVLIRRHQQVG